MQRRPRTILRPSTVFVLLAIGAGCGSNSGFVVFESPRLTSFSPNSGSAGTTVNLIGENFANITQISFNGTSATFTMASSTKITTVVPDAATSGPIRLITDRNSITSATSFTVMSSQASPTITGLTPGSGPVGTGVSITGSHFTGATRVTFSGTPATFQLTNDGQITASVPTGAVTGLVYVTTPNGTAASPTNFVVTANATGPTISGFTPGSGLVGTTVTITGSKFTGVTGVTFNVTAAIIQSSNDTQITTSVPNGASTGPVYVTTPNGTATSPTNFVVIANATGPTISGFTPGSGPVGTPVTITGIKFTGLTGVTFNGTAAIIQSSNDTQITTAVPNGASTGRIVVTTANGSATSSTDFVVTASGSPPTITGFNPGSGPVGTGVTITGTNFTGATSVTFAGTSATFTVSSDGTHITTSVPGGAVTGVIVVTNPNGTATSSTNFVVTTSGSPPTITGFSPGSGPVGTGVTITGTNFTGATSVTFAGTSATFTVASATQITTAVPGGATTGTIQVSTPNGTATSPTNFVVTTSGTSLDLTIDQLYITQSTQTYTGTVPLVAGRPGYLRVFAKANISNSVAPSVRVRFSGSTTQTLDIPSPGTSVPTGPDEGTLNSSWNAPIPGSWFQPGLQIIATVNPDQAIQETDYTNDNFPKSGTPLALDVRTVPNFPVTILPVALDTGTGNVNAGNLSQWVSGLIAKYPIVQVDAQVGATFTGSVSHLSSDGTNWQTLLSDLESKRAADGHLNDRYYYGAVHLDYTSGLAGLGYIPGSASSNTGRTAIGWDDSRFPGRSEFFEIYAHETGHNFGRYHAPCGAVSQVDPSYPYSGASIGVYGFDVAAQALKPPSTTKDIMSYCDPAWVSDYTYRGIMDWRAQSPFGDIVGSPPVNAPGEKQRCLLVGGYLDENNTVVLKPAFVVDTVPTAIGNGRYQLQVSNYAGQVLFVGQFDMDGIADWPGVPDGYLKHFTLAIPFAGEPYRLRVLDENRMVIGELIDGSPLGADVVAQPTVAVRAGDRVQLNWDPSFKKAMVQDGTGEVIAFLYGGSGQFIAGAEKTEVLVHLSSGASSHSMRVPIQ